MYFNFNVKNKLNVLGSYSDYKSIIDRYNIQTVFIVDRSISRKILNEIVLYCEDHEIELKVLSDFATLMPSVISLVDFDGLPFETHRHISQDIVQSIFKRTFDVMVSLFLIILLLPVFIFTSPEEK